MLATPCWCTRPRIFAGNDTCHRCGHNAPIRVTASTRQLAVAIIEVLLGYRHIGETRGRTLQ